MIDQEEKVRAVSSAILEYQLAEQDKISHARGLSEGLVKVAKYLLGDGDSVGKVAQATGLSEAEVRELSRS